MKTCEVLYKLFQRTEGKTILWAEADDPIKFHDILQYQIDSADLEGLKDFYVYEGKVEDFMSYCEKYVIRKRTFEEGLTMFDDDIREMPQELKTMIKTKLSSVYGKTVNDSSYESTNKVIKSYALDKETIEAIDRVSSDLGIKSRSETLREIIKRYDEWQENHNTRN